MRTLSLGLSVELPEAISLRGEAKYAGGALCESSQWGRTCVRHVPCEGCAEMDGGPPCEFYFWHRKWSFLGARSV